MEVVEPSCFDSCGEDAELVGRLDCVCDAGNGGLEGLVEGFGEVSEMGLGFGVEGVCGGEVLSEILSFAEELEEFLGFVLRGHVAGCSFWCSKFLEETS